MTLLQTGGFRSTCVICAVAALAFSAWADDVTDPPDLGGRAVYPVPPADDRTFVLDVSMGCTFDDESPVILNVPVKRYLGPTLADGRLADARDMIAQGLVGQYATLRIAAWDIDYYCENQFPPPPPPPPPCERDRVYFNGQVVSALEPTNSEFLSGGDRDWRLSEFLIPIEKVRFPGAPGQGGQGPTPRDNEVKIEIDVLSDGTWCMAVDWISLEIKCMSPVILIHGNGQSGGFFTGPQHMTSALNYFGLVWNAVSFNPPSAPRGKNAVQLDALLPGVVTGFGADSVHLIAHSKGGLDAREYLERFQPAHDAEFKVLSLSTLGTPHNGSVGADVQMLYHEWKKKAITDLSGFPWFAQDVVDLLPPTGGTPDLRTGVCADFNASNIAALKGQGNGRAYGSVGADADTNQSGHINSDPDEFAELRHDDPGLAARYAAEPWKTTLGVDRAYQTLRQTSAATVRTWTTTTFDDQGNPVEVKYATVVAVRGGPFLNDCLVTIPSAMGQGGFDSLVTRTLTLTGPEGRNHSSVADSGVGLMLETWLQQTEQTNGDLK